MLKLLVKQIPSSLSRLVGLTGGSNHSNAPQSVWGSANSGEDRMLVDWRMSETVVKFPEELLAERYLGQGWSVREHHAQPEFQAGILHMKEVVFSLRNEQDEVVEYSGTLQAISSHGSNIFKLQGRGEEIFNLNLCGFVAAKA